MWITPKAAVAENFDQFVALPNHSKFDLKNESSVVPACKKAFSKVIAEWKMEFLPSSASFDLSKICISVLLFLCKNVISKSQVGTPDKILIILEVAGESEEDEELEDSKLAMVLSNNS